MEHYNWLQDQLHDPANKHDPFWQALELVDAQLQGMMAGYEARVSVDGDTLGIDRISLAEWLALNTMGRLESG